jgi:hypothetical protein
LPSTTTLPSPETFATLNVVDAFPVEPEPEPDPADPVCVAGALEPPPQPARAANAKRQAAAAE